MSKSYISCESDNELIFWTKLRLMSLIPLLLFILGLYFIIPYFNVFNIIITINMISVSLLILFTIGVFIYLIASVLANKDINNRIIKKYR